MVTSHHWISYKYLKVLDELERIISSWLISLGVILANISLN